MNEGKEFVEDMVKLPYYSSLFNFIDTGAYIPHSPDDLDTLQLVSNEKDTQEILKEHLAQFNDNGIAGMLLEPERKRLILEEAVGFMMRYGWPQTKNIGLKIYHNSLIRGLARHIPPEARDTIREMAENYYGKGTEETIKAMGTLWNKAALGYCGEYLTIVALNLYREDVGLENE